MLTLHFHPLSTFARRVRMMLLEKGLEARLVQVEMGKKEHLGEAYRTLNPYGRVPTLITPEGVPLFESTAILEYLELLHPEPALVPTAPLERARMAMHIKLCDLEFTRFTRELFFPRRFFPRERWNLPEQDAARAVIQRHFDILEPTLAAQPYLAGGRWTLAELCYTPFVDFLGLLEISPGPATRDWMERLAQRPSAQQTRLER